MTRKGTRSKSVPASTGANTKKNENPSTNPHPVPNDEKPTIGEELYLVHLHRHEREAPSEDDFDRDAPPRERSRSIGEEMWDVHLKRSRGMEPDFDVDTTAEPSTTSATKAARKTTAKVKPVRKPERCSARWTMHLRNRDIQKTLIR